MSTTENSRCSSPSSSTANVSFLISNKGKRLLSFHDYIFKCNKTTPWKRYWICVQKTCGVLIHTNLNDEFLTITRNHNHLANPDILKMNVLRAKMKSRILNETTSITKIYDEEIAKAGLTESIAAQFPTVIEYRTYFHTRKFRIHFIFLIRFKYEQSSTKKDTCHSNFVCV